MLAAAKKPPVNTTAGIPYNQEYSGGSVGPGIPCLTAVADEIKAGLTLEHVKHSLCYDETTGDIDASEEHGERAQYLRKSLRKISSSHDEQTANTNHAWERVSALSYIKKNLDDQIWHS